MLAIKRIDVIMDIISENGSAMVSDLSKKLGVSEETIRRDFEKLEKVKKIRRVHGGAYLIDDSTREVPIELRKRFFVEEKQRIARSCAELIEDWDCLMLDNSTTALFIAKQICASHKNVSVLTNSLDIANELVNFDFVKVMVIGGALRRATRSLSGNVSVESMERYFANKAFVSCSALHIEFGITDHDEDQGKIRELMLRNSQKRFIVADHTKFDKVAANYIAKLPQISCLITDEMPTQAWSEELSKHSVELVVADK